MKISELWLHCDNYNAAKDFLRERCILRRDIPRCSQCDGLMTEVKSGHGDDLTWRCPVHKGQKISLRDGSFLNLQKISLQDFIWITYFWAHELPVTTSAEMVGVSQATAIHWYSYLRDICFDHLANNPITIGGPDHVVQINEFDSLMSEKRKKTTTNEGGVVPIERWVFAGIDTTTNIGFLSFVPDKSAATLIPLILQYILPGTTIHSDQQSAHLDIGDIPVEPRYVHETINHTNSLKCLWKNCKKKFKTMLGVHSTKLQSHLEEFMWRQQYGQTHKDAFNNILLHISQLYVTP